MLVFLNGLSENTAFLSGYWWGKVWFRVFFWFGILQAVRPVPLIGLALLPLCFASFARRPIVMAMDAEEPKEFGTPRTKAATSKNSLSGLFILGAVVVLSLGTIWAASHRYQVSYEGMMIRRLDRWTGQVSICVADPASVGSEEGRFVEACADSQNNSK
jgi:hypothetical protein